MFSTSILHPMLVHFPIALVIFGFIAEVSSLFFKKEACLSKTGFYLLICGTLAAIIALTSGVLFTTEMTGSEGELKETHELFAWITLITLMITSVLRLYLMAKNKENSNLKWIVFALYGIAAIAVGITGFFGGSLVYG